MKFTIESLILWPANEKNEIREIPFKNDKINIIHGISGTGKSSIISIIDYCLGATKCAIPVGIIRESVLWFGIKVSIRDSEYLIARKTPGNKQASGELYLELYSGEIPDQLSANHSESVFKSKFNSLVNLTNLPMKEDEGTIGFDGRPSYRDMAAFNFLPQHIVANPNTLFFKADSYEHKERLRRVMPFALGIIDREYIAKERERSTIQKQLDDLIKQQNVNKNALSSWSFEVDRLWSSCIELGLAPHKKEELIQNKVSLLQHINEEFLAGRIEMLLKAPNYAYTNEQLSLLQKKEEKLQSSVDNFRREIRSYESLSYRGKEFTNAVEEEKRHVVGFNWLKETISPDNECVACGSKNSTLAAVVDNLEREVTRVSKISDSLFENPIADKEIEKLKTNLYGEQNKLHLARKEKLQLQAIDKSTNDSLSKVYVLIGKIQSTLSSLEKVKSTDDVGLKIKEFDGLINELDRYFRTSDRGKKEHSVNKEISALIEKYADDFELERRGEVVLDKKELTLRFDSENNSRKEYLWEVGSGANWMGYHIATFLALHNFLSTKERSNLPPFSFVVIDQPSQVYFPSAASGANDLDQIEQIKAARKNDVSATRKIFEMLASGLKESNYSFQVIVLEHADTSIWGSVPDTFEAANWKEEGDGLIPKSWLQG